MDASFPSTSPNPEPSIHGRRGAGLTSIGTILPGIIANTLRGQTLGSTSLRKLTPDMLTYQAKANGFRGLPAGVSHFHALSAFKKAAPALGVKPRIQVAVDWLFGFTRGADWEPGRRPIVWPSNEQMQADLQLSRTTVKTTIRQLGQMGLIVMRDSACGWRFGQRDDSGAIKEACGFDLSILGVRLPEFEQMAAACQERKRTFKCLRRGRTRLIKEVKQLLACLLEAEGTEAAIAGLTERSDRTLRLARQARDIAALKGAIAGLHAIVVECKAHLTSPLAPDECDAETCCESGPEGPENSPRNYTTEPLESSSVVAREESGRLGAGATAKTVAGRDTAAGRRGGLDLAEAGITPRELVKLVPSLQDCLTTDRPAFSELFEAAWRQRAILGISEDAWATACETLGRWGTVVAVAVVASKPDRHFKRSREAYFRSLLTRHQRGELHLDRSVWALRRDARLRLGARSSRDGTPSRGWGS